MPVHRPGTYFRYIVLPQGFTEITQKKVDHISNETYFLVINYVTTPIRPIPLILYPPSTLALYNIKGVNTWIYE